MASTSAGTTPLTNRDEQPPAWHTLPIEDALRALGSEPEVGLSTTEATARLARRPRWRPSAGSPTSAPKGGLIALVKGAPEAVIEHCPRRPTASGPAPFDRTAALEWAEAMAARGLRVLAFAERRLDALPQDIAELEQLTR